MNKHFITLFFASTTLCTYAETFSGGYLGSEISHNKQSFSVPLNEIGYSNTSGENTYTGKGTNSIGLSIIGGYMFNYGNHFVGAIEGKLSIPNNETKDNKEYKIAKEHFRTEINYLQGYQINSFLPYVKLGIASGYFSMNEDNPAFKYIDFENNSAIGFNYGLGSKIKLNNNFVVGVDYNKVILRAANSIKFKSTSIGVNIVYFF